MSEPSQGIFTMDELNAIRDVHVAWCASRSINPASPLGMDAVKLIMQSFQNGVTDPDELIQRCESYVVERESHVRLGTSSIESRAVVARREV